MISLKIHIFAHIIHPILNNEANYRTWKMFTYLIMMWGNTTLSSILKELAIGFPNFMPPLQTHISKRYGSYSNRISVQFFTCTVFNKNKAVNK
jgi:hypothetical protein